jgi:hypothetical protein
MARALFTRPAKAVRGAPPVHAPGACVRAGTVTSAPSDLAEELVCVEQEFPGWRPWESSTGRCWATRVRATGTRLTRPRGGR